MEFLHHGGDIYSYDRELIDFSANINSLGISKTLKSAYVNALDTVVHYPDPLCRELTQAISTYEQIPCEQILCGNGAADLIYRTVHTLKPKKALLLAPTFSEYELALKEAKCEIIYYDLKGEYDFLVQEDILSYISGCDLVFICNPNNPTGVLTQKTLLLKILDQCRKTGAYLALDECFMPFVNEKEAYSLMDQVSDSSNLIIFKAFTKFFAMAGLRLGYMLGEKELIEKIRKQGQAWPVSTIAQKCGTAVLKDQEYIKKTMIRNSCEQAYLCKELEELADKVYPPSANYIFFKTSIPHLKDKFLSHNILIRDCSNYHGLGSGYYRIAVKTREENTALIKAFKDIITQNEKAGV